MQKIIPFIITIFLSIVLSFESSAQLPPLECTETVEQVVQSYRDCPSGVRQWFSASHTCTRTAATCNAARQLASICALNVAHATLQAIMENLPPCPED